VALASVPWNPRHGTEAPRLGQAMDQLDETAQRIIEAAAALYADGPEVTPDVYACFEDTVRALLDRHTPVLPP
jgi:hypothetical protein